MTFLLDTNIIGEIRKGSRCNPNVAVWYAPLEDEDLHLSVLVLGEIERGVEGLRRRDAARAADLERWLRQVRGALRRAHSSRRRRHRHRVGPHGCTRSVAGH